MKPELDARVAVEIMGWTRPPNKLSDEEERRCTFVGWVEDKRWKAPDGSYHEHPPAYSSEWLAVGELLDQLSEDRDGEEPYVVCIVSTLGPRQYMVVVNESKAEGTFHEAVCEAALEAKEARNAN